MATAVRERLDAARCNWAGLDNFEEQMRTAKRAIADARHASEDAVAEAALKIRRRPLAAVGVAAACGVVAGAACGLAAGLVASGVRRERS